MKNNPQVQHMNKERIGNALGILLGILVFAVLYSNFVDRLHSIFALPGVKRAMMVVRVLHIIAGCMSLAFGLAAMLTLKGGKWHRINGKVYFWSMFVIFFSGIALSLFHNNIFFFFLSFVSFYPAFVGNRIIKQKDAAQHPKAPWLDFSFIVVASIVACFGIYLGIKYISETVGILLLVFNILLIIGLRRTILYRAKPNKMRGAWLLVHIGEMAGSYIAAVTAFLVNNSGVFPFISPIVLFTAPGVIGGIAIFFVLKKRKAAMKARLS